MAKICRAQALTVITPIRPWGSILPRLTFRLARRLGGPEGRLPRLSFIHFARWSFFKKLPRNGDGHRRERLRYRYLLFETNYNGSFDDYIDSFSYIVAEYMRGIWGTSFGFPGPIPPERFKAYIRRNELPVAHYYVAYPEASTTMVQAAQRLRRGYEALAATAGDLEPASFAAAYLQFVRDHQRDL